MRALHFRVAGAAMALLGALSLSTCSDSGADPPEIGQLVVHLSTPNTDDGAVAFRLTGADFLSVSASRYSAFRANSDIVVLGDIQMGEIARVIVPNVNDLPNYEVTLVEVVSAETLESRPLTGYDITLTRSTR